MKTNCIKCDDKLTKVNRVSWKRWGKPITVNVCRTCLNKRHKKWCDNNKETVREYHRKKYIKNKNTINKRNNKYCADHAKRLTDWYALRLVKNYFNLDNYIPQQLVDTYKSFIKLKRLEREGLY